VYAAGINNAGNVVGASFAPGNTFVSTLWSPDGTPHSMGIPNGGTSSNMVAINNRDEAVGVYTSPGALGKACLLTYGYARESLGTLPGDEYSSANSINDHGMVVGRSGDSNITRSFVWTRGDGMVALPTFGGDIYSEAKDVNNFGQIVGNSRPSGPSSSHPFLYTATGGLVNMGVMGGDTQATVSAINDSGVVVGVSSGASGSRAVTWQMGLGYTDLNTELGANPLGWKLINATSINSMGHILALGQYNQGGSYYNGPVLLTPNAAPVPEPASLCVLGVGAAALLRRKGKGRKK
jgi:uncharacterized membrane protein